MFLCFRENRENGSDWSFYSRDRGAGREAAFDGGGHAGVRRRHQQPGLVRVSCEHCPACWLESSTFPALLNWSDLACRVPAGRPSAQQRGRAPSVRCWAELPSVGRAALPCIVLRWALPADCVLMPFVYSVKVFLRDVHVQIFPLFFLGDC